MRRTPYPKRAEALLVLLAVLGASVGLLATHGKVRTCVPLAPAAFVRPTQEDELAWRVEDEQNSVEVFEATRPGVVMISTVIAPTGWAATSRGNGSGFFVNVSDAYAYVVTNRHVVENATSIAVHTYLGGVYGADVVGTDRLTDLAVLRVDVPKSEYAPLYLADYETVRVGQKAIVMGMPLAVGSNMGLDRSPTFTTGVVSAKDRSLPIESQTRPGVNDFTVENLLQTDAAVNPGNSGGPLLNSSGEVVGVVTAIIDSAYGIGFAIPSDVVADVLAQILSYGEVRRAFMGVSYVTLDELEKVYGEDVLSALGLPTREGALVTDVDAGGPGQVAGIKGSTRKVTVAGLEFPVGGDIIVAIDGVSVAGRNLSAVILEHKPGDVVSVELYRDGRKITVSVTLGSR